MAAASGLHDNIKAYAVDIKQNNTCHARYPAGQCDSGKHELRCSTVAIMNVSAGNGDSALANHMPDQA